MTKAELVNAIASKSGMTKTDSSKALSAVFTSIKEALTNGERIRIPGFGTFGVVERKARRGRNPRTGEVIQIAAKNVIKYKPSRNVGPPFG